MNCPVDNSVLSISERNGVEIDYCPQCRGVWLDRGELDKIIDKSGHEINEFRNTRTEQPRAHSEQPYHKKHKRENFLSDLFDF